MANPLQLQKIEDLKSNMLPGLLFPSQNQPNNNTVGFYEFNNTWQIWNEIDDYYFNASNGIQFTNHYQDYWTKNTFCGIINTNEYCLDNTPFTWSHQTDNSTYVWIYGQRRIIETSYFYINYSLKSGDENMTVKFGIVNNNFQQINNTQFSFRWKITNINIPDSNYDEIYINNSFYNLTVNKSFTNTTLFRIRDHSSGQFIDMDYDNNSIVNVSTNVSITLPYNQTYTFHWIDALCSWSCVYLTPSSNTNISLDETYSHTTSITYSGTCTKRGSITAKYNNGTDYVAMTSSSALGSGVNPVNFIATQCPSGTCGPFSWTVTGNTVGNYATRDTCDFNLVDSKDADGVYINVSLPVELTCTSYISVGASITLTGNNASCFNITADNVILNCGGYNLTGLYGNDWIVTSYGRNNFTIKNCNFQTIKKALLLSSTTNSLIYNNSFYNISDRSYGDVEATAIKLITSSSNNLSSNNITTVWANSSSTTSCFDGVSYGIYLDNSDNNNISNSIINDVHGYKQGYSGEGCDAGQRPALGYNIYNYYSDNTTINSSSINDGKNGIYYFTSNYPNIFNNNFSDMDTSGIYFYQSDYVSIQDNSLSQVGGSITLATIQHTSSSAESEGAITLSGINLESFKGNKIVNDTHNGTSSAAIFVLYTETLEDVNITNSYSGIWFETNAENSKIYNSTISNTTNWSVYVSSAPNVSFFNSSLDTSKIGIKSPGTFFNYYWLWVYTIDQTSTPLSASVNITNVFNQLTQTTTDVTGYTIPFTYLQFNQTSSVRLNSTPYNVTAYKTGYSTNSTTTNLTESQVISLKLTLAGGNCWTYNSGTKLLSIPSGCLYPCSTGGICVI